MERGKGINKAARLCFKYLPNKSSVGITASGVCTYAIQIQGEEFQAEIQ